MQSLGKLVASQASYYTEQLRHSVGEDVPVLRSQRNGGRADYYANHVSPSRWMGSGLDRLDLEAGAAVDSDVFAGLMAHRAPDGERMAVARSHGKVAAFDHTFSAPKSVSLLYAYGNTEVRETVAAAHRQAVSEAFGYMEERCAMSRVSRRYTDRDGSSRFTSTQVGSEGYVAAGFDHFTSRANDPQLHTHVVVINRVWTGDEWRALHAKAGYAHLKAGGTMYQTALRQELTERLGVYWQPTHEGMADIAGFSPELLRHYSTRRTEIEEAVARYQAETGREAHPRVFSKFTLETRQPKAYPRGEAAATQEMKDYGITAGVVDHWNQVARTAPEDPIAVVRNVVDASNPRRLQTVEVESWESSRIVGRLADRQAVFAERDLLGEVSAYHPDGTSLEGLLDSARHVLAQGLQAGDVVRVLPHRGTELRLPDGIVLSDDETRILHSMIPTGDPDGSDRILPGEARYTTRIQLERESQVLEAVTTPSPVFVDRSALDGAIIDRGLIAEQATAVRHLAELEGRLVTLVGPGGSGKTHAVGAYTDAAHAAGYQVVGVATSANAARRLGDELGHGWSGTIAMMRHQLDLYDTPLPEGTVIVVDEASMVSTRDLAWIISQAEQCDGKVVLVGDPKQLPSIDSGGLFHRIVADGHGVVTDLANVNQRQKLDIDRHALHQLRQDNQQSAIHAYAGDSRIHLGEDEYATKAAMVDAWWADTQTHGIDQVRMLASRQKEVAMLNQLARVHMRNEGHLHGPAMTTKWGVEFQAGDRIVVRDNWYSHSDLRNGQTGTITTIHPDTRSVTFQRDGDGTEIVLPASYVDSAVDHAYAQTIHAAQGQTFHTTHLYVDTGITAEHGYTALSRARDETRLWVNTQRTINGSCLSATTPAFESTIDVLARQLARTVIQTPASFQGVAVEAATDQQLHEWETQLGEVIYASPVGEPIRTERLTHIDDAIIQIHDDAQVGVPGAKAPIERLEASRQKILDQITRRTEWVTECADLIQTYTAVKDELAARTAALAVAYQLNPPQDVVDALGGRPTDPTRATAWDQAVVYHAAARIRAGESIDLTDPAVRVGASWRTAVVAYHPQPELKGPVLRLTG